MIARMRPPSPHPHTRGSPELMQIPTGHEWAALPSKCDAIAEHAAYLPDASRLPREVLSPFLFDVTAAAKRCAPLVPVSGDRSATELIPSRHSSVLPMQARPDLLLDRLRYRDVAPEMASNQFAAPRVLRCCK